MGASLRERVLDATFDEVDDHGLAGLTVEGVAVRAGSSRATIYRHFPGGRDELIETTLRREVARFFDALEAELEPGDSAVAAVSAMVTGAIRLLGEHRVFQRLLEQEAEAIAPPLATVLPMIHDALVAHLAGVLADVDVADPAERDRAADFGARMVLSYVGTPGTWNLDDPAQVEALVRRRILAGVTQVTRPDPGQ